MTIDDLSQSQITVTDLDQFLRKPPTGFSVDRSGSGYCVHTDPDKNLVLIDDFHSCRGKVVFHNSLRRKVRMRSLWEYTRVRKSLLSKRIYLLMSVCEGNSPHSKDIRVLKHFVVSIDGKDPFIQWQMERGLDWTIASVAGESYRVDVDLTEALEDWAEKNIQMTNRNRLTGIKPVWRDASFTLKYYSDAMFDFPHWFGFSRRTFKLKMT
ncbi:mesenteric estrogen-dependent adipogenesis protein [Sphaeramia orbicularis]|uniref:Mesenteric estrogen-dependent adipogenesis protein n=1 Tax=Sphaeramia orbicularis TaxID=375764 RepID=A0A673BAX6_9TELE|nr:mesenteric estrogen-dependent adipogenesis protein [Sphaeramia orbicularis]